MGKAEKHYRNDEYLIALGSHCRKLRIQAGYSVNRMAREGVRLSPSVVMRLESGEGAVTVSALLRYAHVLGVYPKKLLDFPFRTESLDED